MLLSLLMTSDDEHGHQWHLSMCRVAGPNSLIMAPPTLRELVYNAFFSSWKEIDNPGKMKEVVHYVGND